MVVERGCVLDHERRVLRIEGRDIALSEAGLWARPHSDGNADPSSREC